MSLHAARSKARQAAAEGCGRLAPVCTVHMMLRTPSQPPIRSTASATEPLSFVAERPSATADRSIHPSPHLSSGSASPKVGRRPMFITILCTLRSASGQLPSTSSCAHLQQPCARRAGMGTVQRAAAATALTAGSSSSSRSVYYIPARIGYPAAVDTPSRPGPLTQSTRPRAAPPAAAPAARAAGWRWARPASCCPVQSRG